MHELSIVQGMCAQVRAVALQHGADKIEKIVVQIGPFAGVVTDSFLFAFEVMKKEDALFERTKLIVKTPEPLFTCTDCRQDVPVQSDNNFQTCPLCNTGRLFPKGGDEIILMQIEMATP